MANMNEAFDVIQIEVVTNLTKIVDGLKLLVESSDKSTDEKKAACIEVVKSNLTVDLENMILSSDDSTINSRITGLIRLLSKRGVNDLQLLQSLCE